MTMAALGIGLFLSLSSSSPASAEPGARLTYEAPASCPTDAEFVAAVAARGGALHAPDAKDAARELRVAIRRDEKGFAGAFSVHDGHGPSGTREVHGRSCNEVADALAVVTAIELNPVAPAAESSPAPAAGDTAPVAAPSAANAPPPSAAPPAREVATPPAPFDLRLHGRTRLFPPSTETVRVGAGELRFDTSRDVGALAGVSLGLLPVAQPRYDLVLTNAHFVTTPEGAQRIVGPVMQLRVGFLGPATISDLDGGARAVGVNVGVAFCQAPTYDSKGLIVLLCSEFSGGALNFEAKAPDGAGHAIVLSRTAGFAQVGAAVQLSYELGAGFELTGRLSGGLTLNQFSVRADDVDGTKSSRGYLNASLGIGYRF